MQDVEQFLACDGFAALQAVSHTKIFLVDGNAYFSSHGPRLVDALEIMANALHPSIHLLPAGLPEATKIIE